MGIKKPCKNKASKMVPPARLELARPKSADFESTVFTDFTTGACLGIIDTVGMSVNFCLRVLWLICYGLE